MDPVNDDDDDRDFDDPLLRELAAAPPIALLDRDLSRMRGVDRHPDAGHVRPGRWRDRVVPYHGADVGPHTAAVPSAGAMVLRSPPPSMSAERSTKHILQSLAVNLGIAVASLGLVAAMIAPGTAWVTGDADFDAIGSPVLVLVGVLVLALVLVLVLVGVALFLAVEIKSPLVGERADKTIEEAARAIVGEQPKIIEILRLITVQQGPGEVIVAAKVRVAAELTADGVCTAIHAFEVALRERCPEVRWSFVEPDLEA